MIQADGGDSRRSVRSGVATALLASGAIVAVASVGLLGYAATVTALARVSDRLPVPAGWARHTWVPVALLAIALLAGLSRALSWVARVVVGAGVVVLGVATALVVWRAIPVPGPEFGLGRRYPLLLLGCTVTALAGLLYLAGALLRRRGVGAPARGPAVLVAVVTLLAVAAVAVGGVRGVDAWTNRVNTDRSTAAGPLGPQRPTTFDGRVGWRQQVGSWAETSGGLVGNAGHGLVAIDPTTGAQRWRYARWDMTFVDTPVASPDGKLVVGSATRQSELDRFGGSASRSEVYVFDAARGRLLAHFGAGSGRPVYVRAGLAVFDDGEASTLTAYRFDGARAWRYRGHGHCKPTGVRPAGDTLIVGCTDDRLVGAGRANAGVTRIDVHTGGQRWFSRIRGFAVRDADGLAVGGGTVFVAAVRGTAPDKRPPMASALDLSSGRFRWRHYAVGIAPGSLAVMYAGGRFVLAASFYHADRREIRLTSVDTRTGGTAWRQDLDVGSADAAALGESDNGPGESVRMVGASIGVLGARDGGAAVDPLTVQLVEPHDGHRVQAYVLRPSGIRSRDPRPRAMHVVGRTVAVTALDDAAHEITVGLR